MNRDDALDLHRPTPEFAAHLEWQVRTELRRAQRFTPPPSPRPWWRAKVAAAFLCAVGLGAGAVWGAQEIRRGRAAELLLERGVVQQELAAARLAFARDEHAVLLRQSTAGLVGREEVAASELRLLECELALGRACAEAEEVAATGREADDRPSAPRVGKRDFVRERLELRRRAAEANRRARTEAASRAELLHAQGFLAEPELERARATVQAAEGELALVHRRLEQRGAFVRGELDAPSAEREALRSELETALTARRREQTRAESALERSRLLHERGFLSSAELRAAERAVAETRAAGELAAIELGVLDARPGLDPDRALGYTGYLDPNRSK